MHPKFYSHPPGSVLACPLWPGRQRWNRVFESSDWRSLSAQAHQDACRQRHTQAGRPRLTHSHAPPIVQREARYREASRSLLSRSSSHAAPLGSPRRIRDEISTRLCYGKMYAACNHNMMHNPNNVGWQSNGATATLPHRAHDSAKSPRRAASKRKDPMDTETYRFAVQQNKPKIVDANHEAYPPWEPGIALNAGHNRQARTSGGIYALGFDSPPAVWYWQVRAEAHHVCAAHAQMMHCPCIARAQMMQKDWDFKRTSLADARRRYYLRWPRKKSDERAKKNMDRYRAYQATYRANKTLTKVAVQVLARLPGTE